VSLRLLSGSGPGRCFPVFPKVDTPYGQALTGLRVQAPFGARVLSFVCCAPNDGFGPQSGLVQRGVLYAAWGSENHTTALRASENRPTSLRSRKCIPPFGGWRHHLPAPLGSVSLDSQSPTTLCESSSLATTSWWDYGCLTMGRSLYRKAWSSLFCPPDGGKSGAAG